MITNQDRIKFVELADEFQIRGNLSTTEIIGLMAEYIRNKMQVRAAAEVHAAHERVKRHSTLTLEPETPDEVRRGNTQSGSNSA